jgi:proline racemase
MGQPIADERMRHDGLVMPPAVSTIDCHTAGEPFRIVAEPPVALPGVTVADRRVRALNSPAAQGLRELLCAVVVATTVAAGRPAVIAQVTGTAYRTGEHRFDVDPADRLVPGFVLR